MGNGSHASICGVGMIDLKFTSGKMVQLKNMQHVLLFARILLVSPFSYEMSLR